MPGLSLNKEGGVTSFIFCILHSDVKLQVTNLAIRPVRRNAFLVYTVIVKVIKDFFGVEFNCQSIDLVS